MEQIRFITDSACDIPEETARELNITVLPIPITMDGVGYHERVDFTPQEFYERLLAVKSIPTTSHITANAFAEEYARICTEGCTHIVVVTLHSGGSNMFEAATMALSLFRDEHPEHAHVVIEVVDSKTYTLAFGYPVIEAACKAKSGMPCTEIISYLNDAYARVEIYFAVYSLEFVKKSGRISAAASFVGDVLGLRPIISIIDGQSTVIEKVRGDKNVVPKLAELALLHREAGTPVIILRAMTEDVGDQLTQLVATQIEKAPIGLFYVGASIAINAGPRVVGLVVMGKARR